MPYLYGIIPLYKGGDFLENKKRLDYINDYNKKNYKQIKLVVRQDDIEILTKLKSVPSIRAYLLGLIRQDIKTNK